ncbi:hypothetical protein [Rossellomorea aquimaris]|uniref:Uncharacterized protein n=1 Tax=Rossellomorea aquimaris TaxID=189382 RepID=A0A1J6W287_9BACI|nr:hypothetical protein [Rossellomorea aquimaris]OIU71698.1 hypothetical protein BHE18_03290 [Rossellomorea aquimaris]
MKKEYDNSQVYQLASEITEMPKPDYDRHFNQSVQEKIHKNLMDAAIKHEMKTSLRNKMQPLFLSLAGIAALVMIISFVIPFDQFTTNNAGKNEAYHFSGNVYNLPNQVVIKGLSNFPEGTVITLEKSGDKNNSFELEDKVKVNREGSFQFVTERVKRDKQLLLNVIIYPHLQTQDVKNILGERGKELKDVKNTKGAFKYRFNGNDYYGLKLMGVAYRVDTTEYHLLPKDLREMETLAD